MMDRNFSFIATKSIKETYIFTKLASSTGMITKEEAYIKVSSLVDRFDEQKESYKQATYNETLTRRDFIDPFFKALGWDIDNEQDYAESYREVIHEDKIKIGGATKAPDYSFRLSGGKRLFFVEAKKPSVLIREEITPAYQVRRYGWSAKLPISIITDFEEFAIYDCTKKPLLTDKASNARIKYLRYTDYLNEFDFIWNTFSKEKVLKGSFDKFIQSDKQKKGTTTVDHEFLNSLDTWRTYLATNIALRNNIDEDELSFVVQHIIDRIIFLRIAEDRSVETYGNLQETLKTGDYYQNLLRQFHTADQKYNSGIFDFKKDKTSGNIVIDNKVIKSIINDLYYPISPYEFSVLSVEILGSAYEQFLGKQIMLTKNGKAIIEEKPEVRKAGGVYYTPQYIVDYIVKNTVGKLVENKTPNEISKIKIVDPACGSGSFLIGAYQFLLDFHKDYYTNNGKASKGSKDNPARPDGNLTTAEKKRILLNNIFGLDLDANAVEVTKLSLLLKCMEGETAASLETQLRLFHDRILPTLDDNIKSGNSLIDTDFYDGDLEFAEERKIKPFNWRKAFPEVFKQHGFDVAIGNPPYVRIQTIKDSSPESITYFKDKYASAAFGNYDLYVLFVEKAYSLLNKQGVSGYILPNKFFNTDYGIGLRNYLFFNKAIERIIDFGHDQIFENATTYCCLLFISSSRIENVKYRKLAPQTLRDVENISFANLPIEKFNNKTWSFRSELEETLFSHIQSNTTRLIDLPCKISRGSSTGNDKVFLLEEKDGVLVNGFDEIVDIENDLLLIPIFATDFSKYQFRKKAKYRLIFPYVFENGKVRSLYENQLKEKYPNGFKYLKSKKTLLEERAQYKDWYLFSAPRSLDLHSNADIVIPLLADRGLYTKLPDPVTKYTLMASGGFSITLNKETNPSYILGLLNSKLLFWVLSKLSNVFRGGWITCTKQYFEQLPIKIPNELDSAEVKMQDEIIKMVDQLLHFNEERQTQTLQSKIDQIQSRIDYCEQRINEIVYQLYELTPEEIKIIEG